MIKTGENRFGIIAVDFDGTLCSDCYPEIGRPNWELIYYLKSMQHAGSEIILWTCRCGRQLEEAVDWCARLGLRFDAVNENVPGILEKFGTDSRKIYADMYLDDKAYREVCRSPERQIAV